MNPVVLGYARLIKAGLKTIEDVPEKYRAEVLKEVNSGRD